MLTKFASAQVISAGMAHKSGKLIKDAHRHEFDYDPRPGFLYVRSRAISSRTNDNYDHFPAEEIKKAYKTFIGKPVFVNHHNENHRRARGVIVDAALHEDITPQGEKDTWVEVLMEIDAVRFPKLAQAILAGHIDRTSMGTDVAYSICSVCNNRAETPLQYCAHIPKMKGMKVRRTTASGGREDVLVYEKCYGLSFFENSLLVEEPADPTAYFLGVDDRGLQVAASRREGSMADLDAKTAKAMRERMMQGRWAKVAKRVEAATYHNDEHYDYIGNAAFEGEIRAGQTVEAQNGPYHYKGTVERVAADGRELLIRSESEPHILNKVNTSTLEWLKVLGSSKTATKVAKAQVRKTAEPVSDEEWDKMTQLGEALDQKVQRKRTGPQWERDLTDDPRFGWVVSFPLSDFRFAQARIQPTLWGTYQIEIRHEGGSIIDGKEVDDVNKVLSTAERLILKATNGWKFWEKESTLAKAVKVARRKLGYGEERVPAQVDTLRDENCPICGESDTFDGDQCMVCQYVKPPDEFMDPDLEKAKEIDLRQDEEAEPIGDTEPGQEEASDNPFAEDGENDSEDGEEDEDAATDGDVEDGEVESEFPEESEDESSEEESEDSETEGEGEPAEESDEDTEGDESEDDSESEGESEDDTEGESEDESDGESDDESDDESAPESESEEDDEEDEADLSGSEIHPVFQEDSSEEDDEDSGDEDKPHTLKFKKKKSSTNTGGIDMRPALETLRKQQATINAQNKRIAALTEGLRFIAQAAGIEKHPQVVAFLKTAADDENPAQPNGWAAGGDGTGAPVTTSEETLGEVDREAPAGGNMANDPTDMGSTTEDDTAADATTDLESSQTVLDEPLTLNEEDVTEVVQGTDDLGEGPRGQAGSGRTETEVRIDQEKANNPEPAFDDASFNTANREARTFAALRLARLRIQAGIEQGDDLVLGTTIANSDVSDEAIASEIETLAKVVKSNRQNPPRRRRNLVPRSAGRVERTVPSFQGAPVQKVAVAPDDDEFLFE